ncbi:MAG: Gfo/Idh/MocA family oxidoreductase [Gemmataceae bacterium]
MALDLTAEQKETGRRNFESAAGELTRRGFMKSMAAGAAVVPLSAAVYFGYSSWKGNKAVKTALLGAGDEGGVLIGDHNPEFNEIVAVADLRPSNQKRIFDGEPAPSPRKGLKKIYGEESAKKIKTFGNYEELLDPAVIKSLGLEAVIIALPLHLHAEATKKCMQAGLHVLCEKLMARSIGQCKDMIRTAKDTGMLLNVGHQRHYSMLYAHAAEIVNSGVLGDIKHIRALWHRNNSWPFSATDKDRETFAAGKDVDGTPFDMPYYRDGWYKPVLKSDVEALAKDPAALQKYGYKSLKELVRWRVYDRTGGGLMAELGSHQMDASSIFLGKVHPLAVQGVGGKFFYGPGRNDRESDDGVFVTYEFPGKNHPQGPNKGNDPSDIVVVTYSSFNTNSFEEYGECLMGSRGTMIVEKEADIYMFKEPEPAKAKSGGKDTAIAVTGQDPKKPVMEASSTWGGGGGAVVKGAGAPKWDTNIRGYRSELEHFAYCVRKWDKKLGWAKTPDGKYQQEVPRCHGEVAMADAILALTANMAMDKRTRIEFDPKWFDAATPDVPETKYGKNGMA